MFAVSKMLTLSAVLTVAACATNAGIAGQPMSGHAMIEPVEHMAGEETPARPIANAQAKLTRSENGALMHMTTFELRPGNVTTAWWVIMTKPELCEASPCSAEDVIGRADIVGTQIVYADSAVNNPDGSATFQSFLPKGPVANGWYEPAFDNPLDAEIHLVLNDHGPLLPSIAASMLTSYRGGCSDESLPPPFPDTAKADGTPGPNQCQLIQDAIFSQAER